MYRENMISGWNAFSLDEVADLKGGYAFKSKDYTPYGHVILRTVNIGARGQINREGAVFIDEEKANEYKSFALQASDTLFVMVGATLGKVGFIRPSDLPALLNQNMWVIRAKENKVNPRYLYYSFSHTSKSILGWASGAARDFVRRDDFRKLKLSLPSLSEQKAISSVLGALDDKIELNRRMSETLEEMARAQFKSWFVDFDPVHAKAEGRDTGLPAHIADLFPDSFEDSELGEIPKGWVVQELKDHIVTTKGRSYRSSELISFSKTAMVTLKSFERGGGYRSDGLKSFVGPFKLQQEVIPGELVIACTDVTQAAEVVGKPAIVRGTSIYETLVASLDALIVRPNDTFLSTEYLYYLALTESFTAHMYAHSSGTTVLHLSKFALPTFKFCLPPRQIVEIFTEFATSALRQVESNSREEDCLINLRDLLLPKLISGEFRFPDPKSLLDKLETVA
ncbi:MAG: restriction endonuclease subunit S [Acidimicrobiales bacterium]|nr:restriction endonuclease subunit S [Acidimicrobiales bacterium]